MPTRRQLLATAGLTTTLAGCVGALGSGDGDETDGRAEQRPEGVVRLEELSVQNNDHVGHSIQLAVEANGDIVHLAGYDLDGGDSSMIDGEWTETAAHYRIHVKRDGDDTVTTADLMEGIGADVECVRALVRVDGDGQLGIWNGAGCE